MCVLIIVQIFNLLLPIWNRLNVAFTPEYGTSKKKINFLLKCSSRKGEIRKSEVVLKKKHMTHGSKILLTLRTNEILLTMNGKRISAGSCKASKKSGRKEVSNIMRSDENCLLSNNLWTWCSGKIRLFSFGSISLEQRWWKQHISRMSKLWRRVPWNDGRFLFKKWEIVCCTNIYLLFLTQPLIKKSVHSSLPLSFAFFC